MTEQFPRASRVAWITVESQMFPDRFIDQLVLSLLFKCQVNGPVDCGAVDLPRRQLACQAAPAHRLYRNSRTRIVLSEPQIVNESHLLQARDAGFYSHGIDRVLLQESAPKLSLASGLYGQ